MLADPDVEVQPSQTVNGSQDTVGLKKHRPKQLRKCMLPQFQNSLPLIYQRFDLKLNLICLCEIILTVLRTTAAWCTLS